VSRFYSRNSTGKYPLDVHELRAAFTSSQSLGEEIRRFRDDRLARIVAGESPIALPEGGRLVLHLVPVGAVRREGTIDLSQAAQELTIRLQPIGAMGWNHRFNLDGFLTFSQGGNYIQLFRTGSIEVLDSQAVTLPGQAGTYPTQDPFVSTTGLERDVIDVVGRCLAVQHHLAIAPPIIVMVTLVGTRGARITTGSLYFSQNAIDRDPLILPEVVVEDMSQRADRILKPVFDALWQSAGLPGSGNYDSTGSWVKRR
jgi:hypothetical protein